MEALLIDIGSTYTKAVMLDLKKVRIIKQGQAYTTVKDDVNRGLKKALADFTGWEKAEYKLACSSAAGGLKMIAVGLVPDLTAEAARRAALGAGSKMLKTFSFELTAIDIEEISSLEPDILLLAGGTDGGNRDVIVHNARMIAGSCLHTPVIIAGNRAVAGKVQDIFKQGGKEGYLTENVMPRLEELNIEPAREKIRELFLEKIIEAKGLDRVNSILDGLVMPTPAAVLRAASLLASGYKDERGLGELVVIDIGGATTDVHSIASGKPTRDGVSWRGLEEPFKKRTVEGDLGMRYSAPSLVEAIGFNSLFTQLEQALKSGLSREILQDYIDLIKAEVDHLAANKIEVIIDRLLARNAVNLSTARHVGVLKTIYTPLGVSLIQEGKDLTGVKNIIGTGGVIVYNDNPKFIMSGALYENQPQSDLLAPVEPELLLDSKYLLAPLGLLAEVEPLLAVKFMKKYILKAGDVCGNDR